MPQPTEITQFIFGQPLREKRIDRAPRAALPDVPLLLAMGCNFPVTTSTLIEGGQGERVGVAWITRHHRLWQHSWNADTTLDVVGLARRRGSVQRQRPVNASRLRGQCLRAV